jgi:hypothetical protein
MTWIAEGNDIPRRSQKNRYPEEIKRRDTPKKPKEVLSFHTLS